MSTPHPGEETLEPKTCAHCGAKIDGMPFREWCDGNRHNAGPACSLHHLHLLIINYLTKMCKKLREEI